jgi:hypothetical protein
MDSQRDGIALDSYKMTRRRFIEVGDIEFGPGFISMIEYYFMRKIGQNPFVMLFSEPRTVYDEWVHMFKGEEQIKTLFEKAIGPSYIRLLESIKRNDGPSVFNTIYDKAITYNAA